MSGKILDFELVASIRRLSRILGQIFQAELCLMVIVPEVGGLRE